MKKLTEIVNEKKVWIYDKEEHLLGMSKQLTAIISDWDTETQHMIEKLHKARDEQVIALWLLLILYFANFTAHTASDVLVTLLPIHYMQILFLADQRTYREICTAGTEISGN